MANHGGGMIVYEVDAEPRKAVVGIAVVGLLYG